jgi:flagellar biosynthesis protein FlhF
LKVKKFTAGSMQEAMKSVRVELGNDAVILNSRIVFSGGFFGFFRKKNFEIIAAADPQAKQEMKAIIKEKQKRPVDIPIIQSQEKESADKKLKINESVENPKPSEDILKEISTLKEMLKSQSFQTALVPSHYPEPVQKLLNLMNEQELSMHLKEKITAALMEKWFASNDGNPSYEEMREFLKSEIIGLLADKSFGQISLKKKFVNVIGPTGVGKTTTLAKIAADCILKHEKKVAFITTDTYRIAAIEQLKTYAQILNIPIEVCYNLEDFKAAAKKFAAYDVVLIDTAGRNFRNKQYVDDLFTVLDFKMDLETYLVLALTSKQKDMEDIVQQFSSIKIDKFIYTKADETSVYGAMINLTDKFKIGAAYITTGQNVPDDIQIASPEKMTNLLIGAK